MPFLLALGLAAAGLQSNEQALAAKSRAAKELMAAGRYADAVPVYRELVQALPGNAGLLLNLGMALHLSGRDGEAVEPLQEALRREPRAFPAAMFLGASYLRLGRADASVDPLEKAVGLEPTNREARTLLVEALLGTRRFADAAPHLRRLARAAPTAPANWFHLGNTYEELAEQALRGLQDRDPENGFALALAADVHRQQKRRGEAFRLYRKAIERHPGLRGLHAAVAQIYRDTGHPDWAAAEEEKERRLPAPNCARDPIECAFSETKYQEVAEAAAKLKTPAGSYWLARAYDALAEEAFARLTALPPSAESHEHKAQRHRDQRRYAESAQEWRQALALAPDDPRLKMQLALTLRLDQDLAGTRSILEGLLRSDPEGIEINSLMGDVLLAQQHPEQAIPYLEKAVRGDASRPHDQGALGRAYALVGRHKDAIGHLQQALPTDTDGSLRLQLGRAYQAAGQPEEAQRVLADYEAFRKANQADGEGGEETPITPP